MANSVLSVKGEENRIGTQAKLRARELLFDSYQQKLEGLRKSAYKPSEDMGKFIATIKLAEDEVEKRNLIRTVRMLSASVSESIDELEGELVQVGLFEKRKKQ
jgi:hypothetical protein